MDLLPPSRRREDIAAHIALGVARVLEARLRGLSSATCN